MTVIGIDPSVAKTGLAVRRGGDLAATLIDTRKRGLVDPGRMFHICEEAIAFLAAQGVREGDEALLVIEGHAGQQGYAAANIALHWMLRTWFAMLLHVRVLVVAPTTLKKFVTSRGNAEKGTVGAEIERKWGGELAGLRLAALQGDGELTEDVLEAFALLKFGECWLDALHKGGASGADEWRGYQREIVQAGPKQRGRATRREALDDTGSMSPASD